MKRITLLVLAVLSLISGITAQTVDDAYRYSQIFYGGTARSSAMGGAFTALGGDASTLNQNPAGIGVFRASEITFTPQLFYTNTTANFNGTTKTQLNNFNLGQFGFIANVYSRPEGLMSFNIGYAFNRTNNMNQDIVIQGVNNTSSMADYWSALGNSGGGTYYKNLTGPEGIAFDTWVMDTITGSGGNRYATAFSNYGDNPPSKYGQQVRRLIYNEGSTAENSMSFGGNYSNKIFFGGTFDISTIRFTSHYEHLETTDIPMPSRFRNFNYTDYYDDHGTGYSFKLGLIYKPIDAVRLGFAFHSPVWYKIDEYFYNNITSNFTDGGHFESSNDPQRFNYALDTPYRILAGIAVQLQKIALVSFDYEFVDYSKARFSQTGDGYDYSGKNQEISNTLQAANNFRTGLELRFDKLYLRGGYGYYGKAFKSNQDNADLDYNSFSGGIGFREKSFSIDFGYTNFRYNTKYVLYPVDLGTPTAVSNLQTINNVYTLTLGYKFGI